MTPLVVVILAAMWILVLVPPLLRSRSEGRPSESISSFRRQLSTLGRATPASMARVPYQVGRAGSYRTAPRASVGTRTLAAPYAARSPYAPRGGYSQRYTAKRRRQQVLLSLVALAFFTAVLALGIGIRMFMWVHLAVDAVLVGYLYLLVRLRQEEEARAYHRAAGWYEAA